MSKTKDTFLKRSLRPIFVAICESYTEPFRDVAEKASAKPKYSEDIVKSTKKILEKLSKEHANHIMEALSVLLSAPEINPVTVKPTYETFTAVTFVADYSGHKEEMGKTVMVINPKNATFFASSGTMTQRFNTDATRDNEVRPATYEEIVKMSQEFSDAQWSTIIRDPLFAEIVDKVMEDEPIDEKGKGKSKASKEERTGATTAE
jgi:hypothetical protein